jgi:predicted kinase
VYRGLLLNGVSGVGKSTMADAVGRVLSSAGLVTAVVDSDGLAQFGPPPASGSALRNGFYDRLKCANLAAVWPNYRALGAEFIVVATGGIESEALRDQYVSSLSDCEVQLVRLVAPTELVRARLRGRDVGATLDRHLTTLQEQEALLDSAGIDDFTVVNDVRPVSDVAREIVVRARWIQPVDGAEYASASG